MELQPTNTEEIQIQYELAMAIGTSLDLTSMVRVAMDAFVRELTCVAAVVYDCRDGRLDREHPVYQRPHDVQQNRALHILEHLLPPHTADPHTADPHTADPHTADDVQAFCATLPRTGAAEDGAGHAYVLPLTDFGFMVLVKEGGPLSAGLVRALEPLQEKLAQACLACIQHESLARAYADTAVERNMLRTLIDNTPVIAFAVDTGGTFLISEGHGLAALGRAPGEVVGKSIFDVYAANPKLLEQVRMALEGHPSTATINVDGLAFDARYEPVRSAEGQVVGVVGLAHDITARQNAEEMLRAVLDTVGEAIVVNDAQGRVVMANGECSHMFGYDADELRDTRLVDLLAPRARPEIAAGLDAYRTDGDTSFFYRRFETTAQRRDGSTFPVEVRLGETKLTHQSLITVSLRDIARRRELDRMRDEFIANVTHELRTPLASIMGWTETLLNGRPGPLTELQARFLTINLKSARRLNTLVEQVLYLANIQHNQLQLTAEPFKPHALIQQVLDSIGPKVMEKDMRLDVQNDWPPQASLVADEVQLELVLTRLLDNAVKFSPSGATVRIVSAQRDGAWMVTIADTGIGIPADEQAHLFQRFYRCRNARAAEIQGTGLGLYISKAIIDAHGGTIVLDSEEGRGTTVTVSLPMDATVPMHHGM